MIGEGLSVPEYVFPNDTGPSKLPELLEKAYAWKKEQTDKTSVI